MSNVKKTSDPSNAYSVKYEHVNTMISFYEYVYYSYIIWSMGRFFYHN